MSIYEIKQPFGVPVIAKDAPRRAVPALASMEATLAAMKADAQAWKRRKADKWGEGLAVENAQISRDFRHAWSQERNDALRDEILAYLRRNPKSEQSEILMGLRGCNRHKLRDMLSAMREENAVQYQRAGNRHVWSVA